MAISSAPGYLFGPDTGLLSGGAAAAPPITQQGSGLLGSAPSIPAYMGGVSSSGGFPGGGVGFGPSPVSGSIPWQNASFANPSSPVQQNFNELMKQNPLIAYRYLADAGGNEFYNLFPDKSTAVFMLNTFKEPGTAQQSSVNSVLGINASDIPAQLLYGQNGQLTGQFGSGNGPSATLSNTSDAWYQSMSDPQKFAEAYRAANPSTDSASVGSPEWWKYLGG